MKALQPRLGRVQSAKEEGLPWQEGWSSTEEETQAGPGETEGAG